VPAPRSPRSAFAVVAASAVGAGTAAASMSGAFAAVPSAPAASAGDTQTFAALPADMATTHDAIATSPAAFTSSPASGAATTAPATLASTPAAGSPTVMAADLHQSDALQIASLSRSVDLEQAQTAAHAAQVQQAAEQSTLSTKIASLTNGAVSPLFDASPTATKALTKAIGKMGLPYVWGAVGPNSFDCSGLVMWSYKQLGVSLPRTAAAQSRVGTPVSKGDLRPGDLVFFYSPVSHVGIYLGNDKILNASESGQPVKVSNMAHMPFHNARRIV
jgi:cell wall-associated NlpC family hydrolase